MPLQPFTLQIKPGVITDTTRYSPEQCYIHSNNIRFNLGDVKTIGGWEQTLNGDTLSGICRTIVPFSDLLGSLNVFFGTNLLAYIWFNAELIYEITPVYSVTTFANPISTTNLSNRVGVTINTGDPKIIGSYFSISGSGNVGGILAADINGIHQIVDVLVDTIYFDAATSATSTVAAGGGASVDVTLYWPAGYDDPVTSGAWGSGTWGSGGWGGTGTTAFVPIRFWSCDTWGEDLIISPSDGPLFYWDRDLPSDRALPISGMVGASQVPVAARQVMVTDQNRIAIAFGVNPIGSITQDPMLVRWCDNENYLEWDPTVSGSAAGELRLMVGSTFVGALELTGEVLIWTDVGLHGMSPSGTDDVFTLRVISPNAPMYGMRAAVVSGDAVFWLGPLGFFRYAGSVQHIPCPVEVYIRSLIDKLRVTKVYAGANSEFNEVWWFFVTNNSSSLEPTMYVKYNYVDNLFDFGIMSRTAWKDADILQKPIAALPTGEVVFHESGIVDATDPLNPVAINHSITIAPTKIDQIGGSFIATRYIAPDIEFVSVDGASGELQIAPSFDRGPGTLPVAGSVITVSATGAGPEIPTYQGRYRMRGRGMTISMTISSETTAAGWRLGNMTILGLKDGRK